MNLKCLICRDLFIPSSTIYGTICGHLFHYNCLLQWIERSPTCPQCRSKSTEKSIHRIYVCVEENAEATDFGTLQNKLDNLQFQMNLKDKDIKNFTEKFQSVKLQNVGLREEIRGLENRINVLEAAMDINMRLKEDIAKLQQKLKNMENVQLVITGSREQVNDMLRHNRDPQSLTILVSALKKGSSEMLHNFSNLTEPISWDISIPTSYLDRELIDSNRKKRQIQRILKDVQNKSHNYKKKVAVLIKEKFRLQQEVLSHKNCETVLQYLQTKIHAKNQSRGKTNTRIERIIAESRTKDTSTTNSRTSPSVPETVQSIKDSESPYLRVPSSSVGLPGLMNYNSKYQIKPSTVKTTQYSLFKRQPTCVETVKRAPSAEASYNGLGGHNRNEEFPTPKAVTAGMKRPKSTSTITSAKFRKLEPSP